MSGVLVGEVVRAASRLYAAGLSRNAVQALVPIAEECREMSRQGSCTHAVIAAWIDRSVRTAERAVAELVDAGVVVVVQRGGGPSRTPNRYYLVPLESWTRSESPAIQVAGDQPRQSPLVAPVDDEVSRHPGGGSATVDPTRSPATQMAGDPTADVPEMAGDRRNSRQNRPYLPPSMDVGYSVPPGKNRGAPALDAISDRGSVPDAPPPTPSKPSMTTPPDGSHCGRTDCRAPGPCRACAQVRRDTEAAQQAESLALAEAERAERLQRARQAEQAAVAAAAAREAAIDACPLGCARGRARRGYLGTVLCDHDPAKHDRNCRGRARVEDVLRARRESRAAAERRQEQDDLAELDAIQTTPAEPDTAPAGQNSEEVA